MGDPIGVFGGTFDPVHNAHLCLAESARSCLSLRAIRWVPTGLPGHRDAPIASPEQRLAMLRLALAGNVHHLIDTAELSSSQPTFTVNTLTRLRAELGARQPLALIIGSDQFTALHTWREWERLFELAGECAGELGLPPLAQASVGGASDGNLTAAAGVATLDGLGAVGDGAHADHEWASVADLAPRPELAAALFRQV